MKKRVGIRISAVILFFAVWQVLYTLKIWPELLFPSVAEVFSSLFKAFLKNNLLPMVLHSLKLIVKGLLIGMSLAIILSGLSVISKTFSVVYNMVVSMFDLIPGIALTPVAILWLGIGDNAIIFIVIHSVIWPMSRSIMDGFQSVPKLYVEVGQNFGLSKIRMVTDVYIPAALPRILSGANIGWARAWRGLISAEMIFGSARGIGYYIQDRRTNMDISGVFATIIVIIMIGVIIQYGFFGLVEKQTVRKWGMLR